MRKLILFDIDSTLIDTHKLWDLRRLNLVKTLNISKEEIKEVEKDYKEYLPSTHDFDPDEYVQRLQQKFGVDILLIKPAFFDKGAYFKSLFPETVSVLKKLSKKYVLGVFSEGVLNNQMMKLALSGIIKYFDKGNIYILRRKKENASLKKLPKEAILIDDNLEVLTVVNDKTNIDCIWINREDKKTRPKFKTIFSLNELEKFVS